MLSSQQKMWDKLKYDIRTDWLGNKCWYLNGKMHREDGPAQISFAGSEIWYLNGKMHREDGPALTLYDGFNEWWIDGKQLTEEEFNEITK